MVKGDNEFVRAGIISFHDNTIFRSEEERNNMIAFLDVLLIRHNNGIDLAVYRKETNTGLYINWNAFAPEKWKTSTLKMLLRRAYRISTKDYLRGMELIYLKETFWDINNFQECAINRLSKEVESDHSRPIEQNDQTENTMKNQNKKELQLILPYAGKKGIAREVIKCFKHLGQQGIKVPLFENDEEQKKLWCSPWRSFFFYFFSIGTVVNFCSTIFVKNTKEKWERLWTGLPCDNAVITWQISKEKEVSSFNIERFNFRFQLSRKRKENISS